jgi:ADP-heptose:LPS heptosyltransferase
MKNSQITLSIITVNLNNAAGLKETAESISRLTYRYYEWLVMDGASKDESLQVLREYNHLITKLVSEPDNGVYNAMNKGVMLATGNMLLFMNSGDIFANDTCLEFLNEYEFSPKEIILGKSMLTTDGTIYPTTEDIERLNRKAYFYNGFIPHQATFIPRQLLLVDPYNEKLKSASDLEFIHKMLFRQNISLVFVNKIIALCDQNGYSNNPKYRKSVLREIRNIRLKYLGFCYIFYILVNKIKNCVKKLLRICKNCVKKLLRISKNCVKKLLHISKELVKFFLLVIIYPPVACRKLITRILPVSKIILIIRPDHIGDYVLFRNLLQDFAQAPQYQGFKFWLFGNKVFADLAETLDRQYIEKFIWVDHNWYNCTGLKVFLNFKYMLHRQKTDFILSGTKFHSIIYPVFSRCTCYDILCKKLSAVHKITMSGDTVNMVDHSNTNKDIYNQIVPVNTDFGIFEYYRNKEFVSNLLEEDISLIKPAIDTALLPKLEIAMPEHYAVFHIDASGSTKEWPKEYFIQVSEYIYNIYSMSIVLLGYNKNAEILTSSFPENGIINFYNKTSLSESAVILAKADLFIGNDSSLLHIAAAVGVQNIICLCNGQYYGRFVPYPYFSPKERYFFIFPPAVGHELEDETVLKEKYADGSFEDMKTIPLWHVLQRIDEIFELKGDENDKEKP